MVNSPNYLNISTPIGIDFKFSSSTALQTPPDPPKQSTHRRLHAPCLTILPMQHTASLSPPSLGLSQTYTPTPRQLPKPITHKPRTTPHLVFQLRSISKKDTRIDSFGSSNCSSSQPTTTPAPAASATLYPQALICHPRHPPQTLTALNSTSDPLLCLPNFLNAHSCQRAVDSLAPHSHSTPCSPAYTGSTLAGHTPSYQTIASFLNTQKTFENHQPQQQTTSHPQT